MTETEWPPIVAVTATIVFFVYYGVIFTHVPPKRSLSFQGRLALHLATSKVGTINVSRSWVVRHADDGMCERRIACG